MLNKSVTTISLYCTCVKCMEIAYQGVAKCVYLYDWLKFDRKLSFSKQY